MFRIEPASDADLEAVARLFREYAASIEIELDYQGFEAEVSSLPGKYAAPSGALLIARTEEGGAIGCVALRLFSEGRCEMKRLYVAPSGRGQGLGRGLVAAIVAEARRIGYREMLLDTLSTMHDAITLYEKNGFERIEAYYDTPVEGTVFMRLTLI